MDPKPDVFLATLASQINEAYEKASSYMGSSLEHAINAGELLQIAKDSLEHGEWMPWLKENFKFSQKTALVYMKLAEHQDQINENLTSASDLSISGALRLIPQEPRGEGQEPEPVEPPEFTALGIDELEKASRKAKREHKLVEVEPDRMMKLLRIVRDVIKEVSAAAA